MPDYLVQEDGTSKLLLEDGSGALLLESSDLPRGGNLPFGIILPADMRALWQKRRRGNAVTFDEADDDELLELILSGDL